MKRIELKERTERKKEKPRRGVIYRVNWKNPPSSPFKENDLLIFQEILINRKTNYLTYLVREEKNHIRFIKAMKEERQFCYEDIRKDVMLSRVFPPEYDDIYF